MPRRPHLNLAGLPLHVIQRGNNRAACFFSEDDYRFYLYWLRRIAVHEGCRIHARVLMTNHIHLLLTPDRPEGVSRLMQTLGRRYVQYVNRTYRRSGTLREGRFKASLVDADNFLVKCYRYIETNPGRAGMVARPAEYPRSSGRGHFLGEGDDLVSAHAAYLALDKHEAKRRQAYAALCRVDLDEEDFNAIRASVNAGRMLGGERFREEISAALGMRVDPPPRGRPTHGSGGFAGEQGTLGF